MKKYRTGIQKQVLHLIEYGCNVMKLPYITTEALKEELKTEKTTEQQLNQQVAQAVYHLKKNKKIIDKGYGKYTINETNKKQYKKCSLLTKKKGEPYCPIKKCFIGNPDRQCIAIDVPDVNGKKTIPLCVGYTTNKENADISEQRLKKAEEEFYRKQRYYTCNPRDPESKYYLPNLCKN